MCLLSIYSLSDVLIPLFINAVGANGFDVRDEQPDKTALRSHSVDEHLPKVYASVIFKLQPSIVCLLH